MKKTLWINTACAAMLTTQLSTAAESEQRYVTSLLEMRHKNIVMQEFDLSCGAATLTMLLNHQHDDPVTEKEVATSMIGREAYLDNPNLIQARHGFSLLDLKFYVDKRGYEGVGFGKLDLLDLQTRAPIMVPINTHGYNHFVIFRGVSGNRVLLADPAWGNHTMLVDTFLDAWIDYPIIGHVGFIVMSREYGQVPPGRLAPSEYDFVSLR